MAQRLIELIQGYNLSGKGESFIKDVVTSLKSTYSTPLWQIDLILLMNDALLTIYVLERYLYTGIKNQVTSELAQAAIDYVFEEAQL